MTIELSSKNEQLVQQLIESGSFSGVDEVVAEALNLLAKRQQFHTEIKQSLAEFDRGERIPADEVFEEIYAKAAMMMKPAS